jgi:hypothetical protein
MYSIRLDGLYFRGLDKHTRKPYWSGSPYPYSKDRAQLFASRFSGAVIEVCDRVPSEEEEILQRLFVGGQS